jgi:hypothetical protein
MLGKIKTIGIVILLIGLVWFFKSWQYRGEENIRNKTNYENLLNEKESTFTEYKFKKEKEFKEYLKSTDNQLKGLSNKLDQQSIKLKRVEKIISSQVTVIDTTLNTIVLDSINLLINKLIKGQEFKYPIYEKTKCFEFKANVVFKNGTVSHEIELRKATDTLNYVTHFERKTHHWLLGIPTKLFGKKIYKVQLFNNCGFSKTIVIKNEK